MTLYYDVDPKIRESLTALTEIFRQLQSIFLLMKILFHITCFILILIQYEISKYSSSVHLNSGDLFFNVMYYIFWSIRENIVLFITLSKSICEFLKWKYFISFLLKKNPNNVSGNLNSKTTTLLRSLYISTNSIRKKILFFRKLCECPGYYWQIIKMRTKN